MSQTQKNMSTLLEAGTRPAPAFGRLGWKQLLFYVPWYYYFMNIRAIFILCASAQFYAKQFSSLAGFYPVGVVLKWRGRLRACSQRLPRRFNTIAPLGAEAWQWLFSIVSYSWINLRSADLAGKKSSAPQLYTFCVATVYLLRCNCIPFTRQLYTFCVATVYLLRGNCIPFTK